jgi:hypothetical protein
MVFDNCSHRLCSRCMVEVVLRGIHCGFSMILVVSIDQYWSKYFIDFEWSFSFLCNLLVMANLQVPCVQPYLLVLFEWSEIRLFPIGNSCSGQLMRSQCFFSITNHPFHLFLDCRKLCMRECDRDRDWVIALYQFEWGVDSFSMSSIVVCEFQSTERM